jgi:hypothetical protein
MKHLLKKISASKSNIIAHIKMGDDTFNLTTREDKVQATYNGCDVLSASKTKESTEKITHVVQDFIGYYLKDSKNASVSVFKNKESGDFDSLMEQLKDIPGIKKIVIKTLPDNARDIEKTLHPDFSPEKGIRNSAIIKCLEDFSNIVGEICTLLNVSRNDALTITQGRLVGTMWGAKPMQEMLESIHQEIADNDKWDRIEFFSNIIIKSIDRLIHKLATELSSVCMEEKKVIYNILIPNILDGYEQFKQVVGSALMSLSSLVYIDVIFKKMTSYPATLFMSSSMLGDLNQDYQKLLGLLKDMPRIERQVIYPLDMMRLQNFK